MNAPLAPVRSLHQIVDKDGNPCKATATETLWVGYGQQQFAGVTTGNDVKPYTTGSAYFAALREAIDSANEEILIAGWQVSWDGLLAPGVRLFDVLLAAAKKGNTQIYLMPWDDSAPVQTFDDQTQSVLQMINDIVDRKAVHVHLAGSLADESPAFFSHHQKQVVIDRKIAFVGGIDLAYGRFDDASYNLHADAQGREAMNRYNGCIAQTGTLDKDIVVDPDLLTGLNDRFNPLQSNRAKTRKQILNGAWQVPYAEDSPMQEKSGGSDLAPVYATIDASLQPRMPWQDAHCRIEGPAVADLARNFILRWNAQGGKPTLAQPAPARTYPKPGSCQIQVLRSASRKLREAEYRHLPYAGKSAAIAPSMPQSDIVRAMTNLILRAQHFIYIENQFFVSDFGQSQGFDSKVLSGPAQRANNVAGGMDQTTAAYISTTRFAGDRTTSAALPKNPICAALAERIDTAIKDRNQHPFHVIITLPVHPEGALNNGAIMTQVHWTMQTLVFGSHSLLNRIRRSLKAQQLREQKENNPERVFAAGNHEYEEIPLDDCFKYVTLLNLRNWEKLGDRYVTEQIYVHNKMMIVDDRYAILGSANINDRSLLGSRDTELAVLIADDRVESKDLCGNGKMLPIRGFAHDLRCEVWRKIFGITGNVRPATELQRAIDHPGAPASWKAIQKVAAANAKLYEDAFDFIPRNKSPYPSDSKDPHPKKRSSASIWPVWNYTVDPELDNPQKSPMPFENTFWDNARNNPAAAHLTQVKGFITALPIEWTKGENNNFGYHTSLVVRNERPSTLLPEVDEVADGSDKSLSHGMSDVKDAA